MVIISSNTEPIILILLTSLLSSSLTLRPSKITGLNCTATTFEEKDRTLPANVTIKPKHDKITADIVIRTTVVNRCATGHVFESIIRKCENLIHSQNPFAPELFTPLTNTATNVTYWNKYCASCNLDIIETNWDHWISWEQYQRDSYPCEKYESKIQKSDVDGISNFTQIFINKGMRLATMLTNNRELECKMEGKWPIHLLNRVIPCLVENFRSGQAARLESCQYSRKNGPICTKMRLFIEGIGFEFGGRNNTIYEKWTRLPFRRGEYVVESGYDNVFYLCERPEIIYSAGHWGHWGKILMTAVSIIFIGAYLLMKFDTKYFHQNFTNKMIYAYSAGIIGMYFLLVFVYLSYPVSCVLFYLAQFLWFYHLFWTKIITAEFFHVIYFACKQRDVDKHSQHKRFVVCCVFGFVLPTILLSIYYLVLENTDNHCPSIPGHFSAVCTPTKNSKAESFMNVLILIMKKNFNIFMPLLFLLAHVCVIIYRYGCNGLKSTENKHHLITLMKMSYVMAFHWILHRICVWYDRDQSFTVLGQPTNMDTISQLSVDLHGILVFLVLWLEKETLSGILSKCGCKSKTSSKQSSDDGPQINVKYRPSANDAQIN